MSLRKKNKAARREYGSYSAWPHQCAEHPNFLRLSPNAKALLFYFVGLYRGKNNGDLSCAWGHTKDAGLGARNTVEKARKELEERGWIVRTRQGSQNQCSLYGVTFQPINECDGKLDEPHSPVALGFWKTGENPWFERQKKDRPTYSGISAKRTTCARVAHHVTKLGNKSPEISPPLLTRCASRAFS